MLLLKTEVGAFESFGAIFGNEEMG